MNEKNITLSDKQLKCPSERKYLRIADLLNEAGMLRQTPRSGYAFLGSGKENVAEHTFRTTVIGHILARLTGADAEKVMLLCLYHDLHEARTGDFNYVNHRYNNCRAREALNDATRGSGLESEISGLRDEMEKKATKEAKIARDADQLDLICNLQMELHKGNEQARKWLDSALPRLETSEGQKLAEAILKTDPDNWWQYDVNPEWWIHHISNQ